MTAQNRTTPTAQTPRLPNWLRIALVGRNFKFTLTRIVVLVVTCFVVFKFILLPVRIEGGSMLPTYREHSVNFVNHLAYLRHGPQRGDVVGIRLAGPHLMYMKRIIGLPGETVAFADGHVLIDDKVLDEPYEKYDCDWNQPPVKLGADEYYVVGDNRTMPPRYHEHGVASRDRILGKLLL
jgi:signal peptidase I